jgi:hypothetical protein
MVCGPGKKPFAVLSLLCSRAATTSFTHTHTNTYFHHSLYVHGEIKTYETKTINVNSAPILSTGCAVNFSCRLTQLNSSFHSLRRAAVAVSVSVGGVGGEGNEEEAREKGGRECVCVSSFFQAGRRTSLSFLWPLPVLGLEKKKKEALSGWWGVR